MANEAALLEQEAPATETPEPSLRETIESAIDEHSEDPNPPAETGSQPTEATTSDSTPTTPSKEPPQPAESALQAQTPAPSQVATAELKAPSQWKPAVREKWNMIPREVQEEIIRREGDSMRLIGSVGSKIRFADSVAQELAPFNNQLQQSGVTPQSFISDVFTSVRTLSSGNPQDKAEVVANIIQSYGVDVRVLDSLLSQRINLPPEVLQARHIITRSHYKEQEQRAGLQQQNALEAEKTLASFGADPKHEFLEQVRHLMADLIEAGQSKTLEDAYSSAIWAHPDTRKILLQREAESRAASKGRRAAAARFASSSVSGNPSIPGGPAVNPENLTLRQSIEAAIDEHTSL